MASRKSVIASDIDSLNVLLKPTNHKLITPTDDDAYQKSIHRWSSAAEKPAGAVLVPESDDAVSIVVKYATDHNIELAVKGGGHSTSGASSTDGGLLIDLGSSKKFKEVRVDKSNNHLIVGGGATWGDVDAASYPQGLVTVGGTVSDTGVGGLTLGGGYGFLSGKLGLTIDHLVSITVVVANGKIITVDKGNQENHPDLFWALRGAGQNFGVATSFTLQGYPYGVGPVEKRIAGAEGGKAYAGMLVFPPTVLKEIVEITNKIYGGRKLQGLGAGGIAFVKPGDQVLISTPIVYHGEKEAAHQIYQELFDLGPIVNTVSMVEYPQINKLLAPEVGNRVSMKGAACNLPLEYDFVKTLLDSVIKFTGDIPEASQSIILFELMDPWQIVKNASNTDMSFGNRGHHFNALIMPMWKDPSNDAACRQWARDVSSIFKDQLKKDGERVAIGVEGGASKKSDVDAVMLYGNYDQYDENSHDIFGANYPRLRKVKASYDPTNTFNKLFSIEPASG